MNVISNQKGITLMVLIITVVILSILVGVSMSIVKNTDIIDNTKDSVKTVDEKINNGQKQTNKMIEDLQQIESQPIKSSTNLINNN